MLAHLGRFYSLKTCPPKSRLEPSHPWRGEGFRRTLPPTFLFLQYSIVKEPTSQTRSCGPGCICAWGPVECRSRGSLDFVTQGRTLLRQRRAALVVEAYIVGRASNCQQGFGTFLNYLRQRTADPSGRCVTDPAAPRFFPPETCRGPGRPPSPPRKSDSRGPKWPLRRPSPTGFHVPARDFLRESVPGLPRRAGSATLSSWESRHRESNDCPCRTARPSRAAHNEPSRTCRMSPFPPAADRASCLYI